MENLTEKEKIKILQNINSISYNLKRIANQLESWDNQSGESCLVSDNNR